MAFASQKVLWRIPQTVLYIGLTVSCDFLGKWLLLQKRFCGGFRQRLLKHSSPKWLLLQTSSLEGSANCALQFISQSLAGVKVVVNCCHVSRIQIQSTENDPSCRCCWSILWVYFLDSCCPRVSNESEYATHEAATWTLNHDWLCLRVGRHRKSLQQCWATRFNQMAGHILFCSSAINLTIHSVRKFPYQGFQKGFSISPFRFFFNRTSSTQPSHYHPMFPACSMCTNHGKTM